MQVSLRSVMAGCAAAMLFAACGGSSSKSSSPSSIKASASNDSTTPTTAGGGSESGSDIASDAACKLVTQAEATTLFGNPAVQKDDTAPMQLAKSVCMWSAKPAPLLSYLLQVRVWDGGKFYTGNLPGYSALPGIGDKAAIYVLPGGSTIMTSYQKGNTVVTISYSVHEIGNANGHKAEDQKDQLVALVKQAAGR